MRKSIGQGPRKFGSWLRRMELSIKRNIIPDVVTDQTSAHDLRYYYPEGNINEKLELREKDPEKFKKEALASIQKHVKSILDMQEKGAICFDYGNNLRAQAELTGLNVRNNKGEFLYPGFVPAYIRPLFCEGKGPFRWAALSGDPKDIPRNFREKTGRTGGRDGLSRFFFR